jgi:hypothetical protein
MSLAIVLVSGRHLSAGAANDLQTLIVIPQGPTRRVHLLAQTCRFASDTFKLRTALSGSLPAEDSSFVCPYH